MNPYTDYKEALIQKIAAQEADLQDLDRKISELEAEVRRLTNEGVRIPGWYNFIVYVIDLAIVMFLGSGAYMMLSIPHWLLGGVASAGYTGCLCAVNACLVACLLGGRLRKKWMGKKPSIKKKVYTGEGVLFASFVGYTVGAIVHWSFELVSTNDVWGMFWFYNISYVCILGTMLLYVWYPGKRKAKCKS